MSLSSLKNPAGGKSWECELTSCTGERERQSGVLGGGWREEEYKFIEDSRFNDRLHILHDLSQHPNLPVATFQLIAEFMVA